MSQPGKVVAVLAANPALSSVLTMVLRADSRLRVRPFESEVALATYMRIAPVDVLVIDLDREDASGVVAALRADGGIVREDFQAIALTRTVTTALREKSIAAGIDEVIVKPMSPRYLLERVVARLERDRPFVLAPGYRGPERRNRLPGTRPVNQGRRLGDNVVELFPQNA